ncbi:inositol-trisphosphate 3-kinase B-like [Pseudonaja textilis]|uniref:Kinase n=1 Tax=Pseudonaja textilis TaxID=8673 RepID=A0A670ZLW6_PSETE|nr:inositol-trisphosphate 3-kinase B-like [Pseudonaja textilis]XP_026573487.1 inositol-trisphosphate 3-kinase B-like [Pseudonaja textilis]
MEWIPASSGSFIHPMEPERWEAAEPPSEPARAAKEGAELRCGAFSSNGLQTCQGSPPCPLSQMTSGVLPAPAPSHLSQAPGMPSDRSISASSTCSSLASSSQESDDVFSDIEGRSVTTKKRVLRKTKSWKTFFTMVHWSLRRRSSWVQLAGHEGNFKPSEGGQILKKFSAVEAACLSELMTDVLRPFVPTYHGVAEVGGERYIQMDDLLRGLQRPSIMDCKMGTRTYLEEEAGKGQPRAAPRRDLYQKMVKIDPWAPTPEEHSQGAVTKPRYMQWRESSSSSTSLGFRIEGVTIEGGTVQRDFKQTRSQDQIIEIFLQFVKNRVDVLKIYLARLENLCQALEESNFFKRHEVIGSSLLFLHDQKGHASIWMIDFGKTLPAPAHSNLRHDVAWTPGSHEDGYLIGLQHLTHTIRATLARAEQSQEPLLGPS